MPQGIWLNKFGVIVEQVFGHTAYQVGSSLKSKDWRDVDVRLILPDDEYDAMFGKQRLNYVDPKLAGLTLAFSALAKEMTGLPVDFQFQRQTHANKVYGGEWRSPLMEMHAVRSGGPVMTVPDEAIEAAHRAVLEYKSTRGIDNQRNAMRAALEAAAPYLRAQALEDAAAEVDEGVPAYGQGEYADWLRARAVAERGGE